MKCPRCPAILESQILLVGPSRTDSTLRPAFTCPSCNLTVLGGEGMALSELASVVETKREEIAREAAS